MSAHVKKVVPIKFQVQIALMSNKMLNIYTCKPFVFAEITLIVGFNP